MLKIISDRAVKLKTVEDEDEENSRWNFCRCCSPFVLRSNDFFLFRRYGNFSREIELIFLIRGKDLQPDRLLIHHHHHHHLLCIFSLVSSSSATTKHTDYSLRRFSIFHQSMLILTLHLNKRSRARHEWEKTEEKRTPR